MGSKNILFTAFALSLSIGLFASGDNYAQVLEDPPLLQRSRDVHMVPDDSNKTPAQIARETANQQIKESLKEAEPETVRQGQVVVSPETKNAASRASAAVVPYTADKVKPLLARKANHKSVALALGGGGARGAAHIGVLKVLQQEHIPIDYVVGTSMGSIVGGLYAAGVSLDQIEEITVNASLRKAYTPERIPVKVFANGFYKLRHPFLKHYAGVWSGSRFDKFLSEQLPKGVENVQDTRIPFSAVATNLADGKAYRISVGKLSTVMRASSSIPPLLQPVAIDDKIFIDGGMRANMPASAARDTGAGLVIGVLVDQPLKKVPAKEFRHTQGIAYRLLDVLLDTGDERQIPYADVVIRPDVSKIPVLSKDPKDARIAIQAGEEAARKAIPEIRKRLNLQEKQKTASVGKQL